MSEDKFTVNTWDHVGDWREVQLDPEHEFHFKSLEKAWSLYCDSFENKDTPERDCLPSRVTDTPVHEFLTCIENDIQPCPELLLTIAEAFSLYFEQKGNSSLEHIFFGKEKRRIGNRAARDNSQLYYETFSLLEGVELIKNPSARVDFEKIRIETDKRMEVQSGTDLDNVLRQYRRWKVKFDAIHREDELKTNIELGLIKPKLEDDSEE